jgi:hypothetical protein
LEVISIYIAHDKYQLVGSVEVGINIAFPETGGISWW